MPFAWGCALIGALLTAAPAATSPDSAAPAPPQAQLAATPLAPSQTEASTQSASPNTSEHPEQTCDALPVPGVERQRAENVTLVSVKITAQGKMHDPTLFRSSGNNHLDAAVLACANGHYFPPELVGGERTDINWTVGYFVFPRWSGFATASPSGFPHICGYQPHPPREIRHAFQGDTVISYRVASDGSVSDAAVSQASGKADLDQQALKCVSSWRFFPVTKNGQPVELNRTSLIQWRIQ